MAGFEKAVNDVLLKEGGYSDHPADRGGPTNFGITQAVARKHGYTGWMNQFPREQAIAIYRTDYWDAIRGDELPEALGIRMLDFAVNAGPGRAIRALQRALHVTDDGIFGRETLEALKDCQTAELGELIAERVRLEQLRHYRDIVKAHPDQGVFLLRWVTRATA